MVLFQANDLVVLEDYEKLCLIARVGGCVVSLLREERGVGQLIALICLDVNFMIFLDLQMRCIWWLWFLFCDQWF